ncbi:MAG TPA: PfkB family carbohydrate kinase, partial [Candidatus Limnocylindrales bacterium]|nr:PfkB family carbohydrate kinase [Candidatus Limnocylindrales bacterium]
MTDALVVGRVGVDLTPTRPRTSLADADAFTRAVGGFAGNIATGLARVGVATGVVSGVGDDAHGGHVRQALASEGVDVAGISTRAGSRTQVAFFEAWPPDRFPVTFYRVAPAPETLLTAADLPQMEFRGVPIVILSGALLAEDPVRSAVIDAFRERADADRGGRSWTLLDLDWRPTLWPDPVAYPARIAAALELSDVVVGSLEEFAAARLSPEDAVGREDAPRIVVVKHGADGVALQTATGRREVSGIPVDVVCGLGAGDALTAAFAAGLLAGLDPFSATERGNAA